MGGTDVRKVSKAFKALANPNRLQIFLNLLSESDLDVGTGEAPSCFLGGLLRNLNIGAPTVSHHIKELVNADLITTERIGKQLQCSINPAMIQQISRVFTEVK
jgi:ArsR family transcriptional regulator, arsenate/arsenite/antimonite-responsive transcriptional repressor